MESGGVAVWNNAPPAAAVDDQYAAAIKCCEDTLNSLEPSLCSDGGSPNSSEELFTPRVPVKNKYGPNVEVYISRSLKPPAGGNAGNGAGAAASEVGGALATSTPVDASHGQARSSSPARGVHFSPVVSEVNWRESYIEPEGDGGGSHPRGGGGGGAVAGVGRRGKKPDVESNHRQDPPQKVKVTTTEGNMQAVQKIQVTSVGAGDPTSAAVPVPVAASTLPRSSSSSHSASGPTSDATSSTLTSSAGTSSSSSTGGDRRSSGLTNGKNKQKSATLPSKIELFNDKNSGKTGNSNNKGSSKGGKSSSPKVNGKGGRGHDDEDRAQQQQQQHQSIWKRLGIGRISFGKGSKSGDKRHGNNANNNNNKQSNGKERSSSPSAASTQSQPIQTTPTRRQPTPEIQVDKAEPPPHNRRESDVTPRQLKDVEAGAGVPANSISSTPNSSRSDSRGGSSENSRGSGGKTAATVTDASSLPPRPPTLLAPPLSLSSSSSSSSAASKHLSPVARARLVAARKKFLEQQAKQQGVVGGSAAPAPAVRSPPLTVEEAAKSSENLRIAFERFRQKAEEDRRRLARSVPDLQEVESSVKSAHSLQQQQQHQQGSKPAVSGDVGQMASSSSLRRADAAGKASQEFDKRWEEILARSEIRSYGNRFGRGKQDRSSFSCDVGAFKAYPDATDGRASSRGGGGGGVHLLQYPTAAQYFSDRYRSKSTSGLRGDVAEDLLAATAELDSGEALFLRETHLGRFGDPSVAVGGYDYGGGGGAGAGLLSSVSPDSAGGGGGVKARSMVNLGADGGDGDEDDDGDGDDGGRQDRRRLGGHRLSPTKGGSGADDPFRAKSMEFLLDDENKEKVKPPENSLMREDRQLSEHELRFQKSLQRLNVPDWYKRNAAARKQSADGGVVALPRRRAVDRVLPGGWEETKTASMSSLQSSRAGTPTRGRSASRPICDWRYGSSRDNVMSPDSAASSPVPSEKGLNLGYQPYSHRWGASAAGRLSGSASPSSQLSVGGFSFTSQRSYFSTAMAPASSALPARRPYLGWRSQERLAQQEKLQQQQEQQQLQNGDGGGGGGEGRFGTKPLVVRKMRDGDGVSETASTTSTCLYLSPAERLARGLVTARQQQQTPQPAEQRQQQVRNKPPTSPEKPPPPPPSSSSSTTSAAAESNNGLTLSPGEVPDLSPRQVRNSIKEVTNAIVHYCSESDDDVHAAVAAAASRQPLPTPTTTARPSTLLRTVRPDADDDDDEDEETPVTVVRHPPRRLPQWPPPTQAPQPQPASSSSSTASNSRPRVWVESSFVGIKPIVSPKTPPVGDVVSLFDAAASDVELYGTSSAAAGDGDQLTQPPPPELVPIEKLRTGSAQIDPFFGKRDLRRTTNGELWLQ